MRPIVASPTAYAYRNRITVHAQDGLVGFFRRDSHRLIDIERCPIAMDEVNGELTKLRAQHPCEGHYTLRATSGPRIFSQTNDAVANALRDIVLNMVPSNQHLLVDAYCGAGFFAKAMLEKFERIIGIDWDKFAIGVASRNATSKETYLAGDIEEQLLRALEQGRAAQTTLLVDPPATGLSESIRKTIVDLTPATFIYVSCNPPTLARDLRELTQKYMVKSVTPLDMFPQTAEIEVAVHLQAASAELPR
jgi:23S rRNA (uracil1939-C5)-methyltransferase